MLQGVFLWRLKLAWVRDIEKERQRAYESRKNFPEKGLISGARWRANRRGIEFRLSPEDIKVPPVCPVLGIPIVLCEGRAKDGSPSLDRINNKIGYIPGNVRVISWRANRIKSDASEEELEKIIEYMKTST